MTDSGAQAGGEGHLPSDLIGPASLPGPTIPEPQPEPNLAEPNLAEPSLAEPSLAEPSLLEPEVAVVSAASEPVVRRRRGLRGLLGRILGRIPHPPLRSRRGLLVVAVLGGSIAVVMTIGGVVAIQWTETADFCGRCHTMAPELKAYEMSPHKDVTCAECHVEPGIAGWVKSKLNGTRQLVEIITGTFPKPIPAPDHAELPSTQDTCLKCHALSSLVANGGPVSLVLNTRYTKNEENTPQSVALVVRPNGFGDTPDETARKGVHWHIVSDVEYLRADLRAQKIDYVKVNNPDGTTEEYIASNKVEVSSNVGPDIDALKASETLRRMDCLDCHNRVGHGIPGVDQAIDSRISAGGISPDLPWVKSQASELLNQEYASIADANAAIASGLTDYYSVHWPLVAQNQSAAIEKAVHNLQATYALVATPDMRVTAATYPNNLGHQTAPGCFRCHDGAHYKVVDGSVTDETIPAGCATCHTFPQIGSINSGVLIGQRPETHSDRLWVFSHRNAVDTVDASKTECGACHTQTYCENCHDTKAVQVPHKDMVFNHGKIANQVGAQTCAFCHQPVYCAQCHSDNVLPNPYPEDEATPPPGSGGGVPSQSGGAFLRLRPLGHAAGPPGAVRPRGP